MINIIFRHRYLLAFFVACLLAVGLAPRALAADNSYTNVNSDWSFTYSKSKDIIIAQKDNRIAVYQTSDIGWEQQPDYYNQGGETFSCGSHIVLTPGGGGGTGGNPTGGITAPTSGSYTLYEGDKGGCADDQYYDNVITVGVSKDLVSKDLKAASIKNYGQEPVGCPGFAGTPEPGSYYPCPNGKAGVIDGKYDPKGAAKAKKAAEDAANAALAAEPVDDGSNDGCWEKMPGGLPWLMCPGLDAADSIYGFFKGAVFKLLALPELGSNNDLKASWSAVKSIANASLILVALVMIGSQIFNFSFIDAYTVKKVLPRLVIAVILIQLSWFLFTGLIQITNAVGYSLTTLLTYPFKHGATGISSMMADLSPGAKQTSALFTGATIGIGVGVGAAALAGGAWISLALVAVGVIISVLVAFFTLIIRKLLLFILLVLSPIALVAWILPNTQKLWATWWSLFSKLLIMFPLIAILFAAGQIGASVIITSDKVEENPVSGGINAIIALIAYFAPLFLVPSTFKFAGGIFNTITGALDKVGGKAKGSGMLGLKKAAENAKTSRATTRKERGQNWSGSGNRFKRGAGRMMAGTAGASGAYGRQLRAGERETGVKNAGQEIAEGLKAEGITDYYDQLDYKVAVAKGQKTFTYTLADGTSKTINVESYGDKGKQAAAMSVIESGKGDRIRDIRTSLAAEGATGEKIWADTMETHAGKAVAAASDVTGKPFENLKAQEMATQDQTSLRNMAAEYNEAVNTALTSTNAGEAAKASQKAVALENIAKELIADPTHYGSVTQTGKSFIEYVGKGGAGPIPVGLGTINYKGGKIGKPGVAVAQTLPQAEANAKAAANYQFDPANRPDEVQPNGNGY